MSPVIRAYKQWRRFTLLKRRKRQQLLKWCMSWFTRLQQARQREWRNEIRAQVHHNYVKYTLVWNAWMDYVHIRRGKIAQYQDARVHWYRQFTHALEGEADKANSKFLAIQSFKTWSNYAVLRRKSHEYYLASQYAIVEQIKGKSYYEIKQKSRILQALSLYTQSRLRKKADSRNAKQAFDKKYFFKYFELWNYNLILKQSELDMQRSADECHELHLLKGNFCRWKSQMEQTDKFELAILKHEEKLKKTGISAFRNFKLLMNSKKDNLATAEYYHYSMVLNQSYNTWKMKLSTSLNAKRNEKLALILSKYVTLKLHWNVWQKNITRRENFKIKWKLTEARYETIMLSKHFAALKVYTQKRRLLKSNCKKFTNRQNVNLMVKYLDIWQFYFKNLTLYFVDARYFNQSSVLAHFFSMLKDKSNYLTNRRLNLELNLQRFQKRRELERKQNIVEKWINSAILSLNLRYLETKSSKLYQNVIFDKYFGKWIKITKHRQWVSHTTNLANSFRDLQLYKVAFAKWSGYSGNWKQKYNRRHILPQTYWGLKVCHSVMNKWKEFLAEKKQLANRINLAKQWREEKLSKEGLWMIYNKSVDQQLDLQRQSEWKYMTARQKRLAIKYGMRWRYKIIGKPKPSIFDFNIDTNARPAPRMPSFLFEGVQYRTSQIVPKDPSMEYDKVNSEGGLPSRSFSMSNETLKNISRMEIQADCPISKTDTVSADSNYLKLIAERYRSPAKVNVERIQEKLLEWQSKSKIYYNDLKDVEQLEALLLEYCDTQYSHAVQLDFVEITHKLRATRARVTLFLQAKEGMKNEIKNMQQQLATLRANKI
ncbi:hypothetical protein HDV01_000161 [Terramyces sp. JEL0728]|nr:hypothetical protein HDV01_000161 [Terramyces sp. JEL0728]